MLYMIGLGLGNARDITVNGLEAVKKCSRLYLEGYTSVLQEDVEELAGRKVVIADREMVEQQTDKLLHEAEEHDIAFMVVGDVFSATTHIDLFMQARKAGIEVQVINNASVLTAVGVVGLELYKYGKVTSIPFENENIVSPYEVLMENLKIGLHTLFLLDLDPANKRFMTANEAMEYLLRVEEKMKLRLIRQDTRCVGCARLGTDSFFIKSGTMQEIIKTDFGKVPHCLIVPAKKLHFVEEQAVEMWE
ncbi:MAG: diphthine synthase [archaeon]